ncbi:MAG: recombinase family protein [Burkholderiales bacterium]|nr:recombinase family protein [Burkholderiales bacterium]
MEKVVIYARVSTNDQTTENQILKLRTIVKKNDWELTEIYVDEGISGAKGRDKRPEFDRVCKDMVRRKFDRILVWDVSRLGRSLQHLVEFLNEALTTRTDLYIHQSGLDTSTPSGRMMFQIIGVFSEFERTIISSRVKAGLSRVKSKGKKLGRPVTVTTEIRERVLDLIGLGKPYSFITQEVGIPKGTVSRIKKEATMH